MNKTQKTEENRYDNNKLLDNEHHRSVLDNDGNYPEEFESSAVIVRSKQNRASPSAENNSNYNNGVAKEHSPNGDSNIEAGCEILCLKFLCSGRTCVAPNSRGK